MIHCSALTLATFWDLSDMCEHPGSPQMVPSSLDWQTTNWKLPYSWLVLFAIDLAS